MSRRERTSDHLIALFLLGLVLLLPPILLVFNRPVRVIGIPILYLYLFTAWGVLIGLAAVVARRIDPRDGAAEDRAGPNGRHPAPPTEGTDDAER